MTGRVLDALNIWWQKIGDAVRDRVTVVAFFTQERTGNYLAVFLFGYFEFKRAFAHRTG
jgi:hypothetical protein